MKAGAGQAPLEQRGAEEQGDRNGYKEGRGCRPRREAPPDEHGKSGGLKIRQAPAGLGLHCWVGCCCCCCCCGAAAVRGR